MIHQPSLSKLKINSFINYELIIVIYIIVFIKLQLKHRAFSVLIIKKYGFVFCIILNISLNLSETKFNISSNAALGLFKNCTRTLKILLRI